MIQIGLLGSSGRMGSWVKQIVVKEFAKHAVISAEADSDSSMDRLLESDVVIDFSLPQGAVAFAKMALSKDQTPAFIVGSTGWTPEEQQVLNSYAEKSSVLQSTNFSLGVFALREILQSAAPMLESLGYTPVLTEAHHQHKKDAPSGTAKTLQSVINPKNPSAVQTHAVRAGEVIGDHEVVFHGPADTLKIGHFAQSRSIFAQGAVEAAIWLAQNRKRFPRGFVTMGTFWKERISS